MYVSNEKPTTEISTEVNYFERPPQRENNDPATRDAIDFHPLILVVEHDDDTRLMLTYLLRIWKYRVIEATNGADAVLLAEEQRPDLILMNLEGANGLTTSRRMRELSAYDGATIVLISSPVEPDVRTSALAAADDFLIKPIDFGYLEEILEKYLRSNRRSQKTAA